MLWQPQASKSPVTFTLQKPRQDVVFVFHIGLSWLFLYWNNLQSWLPENLFLLESLFSLWCFILGVSLAFGFLLNSKCLLFSLYICSSNHIHTSGSKYHSYTKHPQIDAFNLDLLIVFVMCIPCLLAIETQVFHSNLIYEQAELWIFTKHSFCLSPKNTSPFSGFPH